MFTARKNIVPVDSDEARETATGHSCGPLAVIVKQKSRQQIETKKLCTFCLKLKEIQLLLT